MYTKKEMETLNRIARDWYECDFNELNPEEQDQIYCYAEEEHEFEHEI